MAEETKTEVVEEETAAAEAAETETATEEEAAENTIVKKTKTTTTTTVTTYGNETVTVSNGLTVKQALLIGLGVGAVAGFLLKACVF